MKIVVCNHALAQVNAQARWRRLVELYPDVDLTLILPNTYVMNDFGRRTLVHCPEEDTDRFHVRNFPMGHLRSLEFFRSFDLKLRQLKPDIIFVMYPEYMTITSQFLLYRSLFVRAAKVAFFSINNWDIYRNNWVQRLVWRFVKKSADAAFCHCHEIKCVLRRGGFKKPIHIQTNVGVDERKFRPDAQQRNMIRSRFGLDGFVVGYCGRLENHKAVDELIKAIDLAKRKTSRDISLLIAGDGSDRQELEELAVKLGVKVCITGALSFDEVPPYFNAFDAFVLPSSMTSQCKEVFGLTLAQAMATRVPVIGATVGAVSEVIGAAGLIYAAGFPEALARCIEVYVADERTREYYAKAGYDRCLQLYSATALAHDFHGQMRALIASESCTYALCP